MKARRKVQPREHGKADEEATRSWFEAAIKSSPYQQSPEADWLRVSLRLLHSDGGANFKQIIGEIVRLLGYEVQVPGIAQWCIAELLTSKHAAFDVKLVLKKTGAATRRREKDKRAHDKAIELKKATMRTGSAGRQSTKKCRIKHVALTGGLGPKRCGLPN